MNYNSKWHWEPSSFCLEPSLSTRDPTWRYPNPRMALSSHSCASIRWFALPRQRSLRFSTSATSQHRDELSKTGTLSTCWTAASLEWQVLFIRKRTFFCGIKIIPKWSADLQVVICAGCDQYPPWASLVVGCLGYFAFQLVFKAMQRFQSNASILLQSLIWIPILMTLTT